MCPTHIYPLSHASVSIQTDESKALWASRTLALLFCYNHAIMHKTKQAILEEIAAERRDLIGQIILTTLTGVGLIGAVVAGYLGASPLVVYGLFALAYIAGGAPAAKEALISLWQKELNIDLLMVLAALAAAGVGEVRDGAILLFLFSLAGTLEHYAMGNTKRSVAALMDLRPDEANRLLPSGETERVAVEALAVGDTVLVRPGERVPIDGEVVAGGGAVNQAPITGESVPVDKLPGDKVFAGSVNVNALLTIAVTAPASRSTLARMIELVMEAEEKRSPSERFSEWFGQRYTFIVLFGSIAALGIFLLLGIPTDEALYKAATLLVVASPCAIVISVPAAVLSAIAAAARQGVLFKGGAALEDFGNVSTIAFDKTGTLTVGAMSVARVESLTREEGEFLSIVATLEAQSDHPLARSIVAYAKERGVRLLTASRQEAVVGQGVVATIGDVSYWAGNGALAASKEALMTREVEAMLGEAEAAGQTPILVGTEHEIIGIVTLADTVRPDAVEALAALRAAGVKELVVLTGDTQRVATAIGTTLGLSGDGIKGGLMPADKVTAVETLSARGTVAFVGDGVNDAAALATARVGIAMGVAGTDAALEAADVALLSDDLRKLVYTYKLSRKANQIIRQNLYFACGIMAIMVVYTIFGDMPLPLGVIGHEGGTLLVVANGLRLLFMRDK